MQKLKILFLLFVIGSCKQKPAIPNISKIEAPLTVLQFENSFFNVDTNRVLKSIESLHKQYNGFTQDFTFNILGISQNNEAINANVKAFIHSYMSIYTDSKKIFTTSIINDIQKEVQQALKFTKYYFPNYKAPNSLITFIGPLNSYANIITSNNQLAVGLQLYMGANYFAYTTEQSMQLYPSYVSKRFTKDYIAVNCVKNIISDIMLQQPAIKPNNLIEEIVEQGKQQYIQHAILPYTADSIHFGYTAKQTEDCFKNEKAIYTMFIKNNLLFETDRNIISPYISDAPNTETLGKDSPGNIGLFMGYKIVSKWMLQQKNCSLTQLLQTPPQDLFNQAKYKP